MEGPEAPAKSEELGRRAICDRCKRPQRVCVCAALPAHPLRLLGRILILQHPHELKKRLATVPLLRHCLDEESLTVVNGRKLQHPESNPALEALFEGAQRGDYPLYVLFPGQGALDLASLTEGAAHVAALQRAAGRKASSASASRCPGAPPPSSCSIQAAGATAATAGPAGTAADAATESEDCRNGIRLEQQPRPQSQPPPGEDAPPPSAAQPPPGAAASWCSCGHSPASDRTSAQEPQRPTAEASARSSAAGAGPAATAQLPREGRLWGEGADAPRGGPEAGPCASAGARCDKGGSAACTTSAAAPSAVAAGGASATEAMPDAPRAADTAAVAEAVGALPAPAYLLLVIDGTWRQAREMAKAVAPRCLPPVGPGVQVALAPSEVLLASVLRPERGGEGQSPVLQPGAAPPLATVGDARCAAAGGCQAEEAGREEEQEEGSALDYDPDMPCLIRKEPVAGFVTTYEATARAVGLLERNSDLGTELLAPLRLMTRLQASFSPSVLSRMRAEPETGKERSRAA